MSELIDRIFDVEKISGEVGEIISLIKKSENSIKELKGVVETLLEASRKIKNTDALIKNTKTLNDTVVKGGVEMKNYKTEVEKLKEKTEQLTTSERQANIEIAKARLELQKAQKEVKATALAEIELNSKNDEISDSYNALQKDLKKSIEAFKNLSEAERKNSDGKALLTKIQSTQKVLKETDAAMGNYQRNVGNYASALDGLNLGGIGGQLQGFAQSASQMAEKIQGLGTPIEGTAFSFKGLGQSILGATKQMLAFLATPIGAIIGIATAIGLAVKEIFDYNASILENQKLIENLTGKTGKFADEIRTTIQGLADTFGIEFKDLANAVDNLMDTGVAKNELEALDKIKEGLLRAPEKNKFISELENTALIAKQVGANLDDIIKMKESIESRGINSDAVFGSLQKATKNLAIGSDKLKESLTDAFGSSFSTEILNGVKNGELTTVQALEKIDEQSKKVSLNNTERANIQNELFGKQALAAGGLNEILGVINDTTKKGKDPLTDLQNKTLDLANANIELEKSKDRALKSDAIIKFQETFSIAWVKIKKGFYDFINGQIQIVKYFFDTLDVIGIKIQSFANTVVLTFQQIAGAVKNFDLKKPIDSLKSFAKIDISDNFKKSEIAVRKDIEARKLHGKTTKKIEDETEKTTKKIVKNNDEIEKSNEKAGKSAEDKAQKILEAERRLRDSEISLMKEGEEKQITQEKENLKRKLEDLQKNGELTAQLKQNLETISQNNITKIQNEAEQKRKEEKIKSDELVLENLKKSGADTTKLEKQILTEKMNLEIKAGGDEVEIRKKYSYLLADVDNQSAEKKIQAFEKLIKKEADILKDGFDEKAKLLKQDYASGLISKEQYEQKLSDLQLNFAKETNDKTIELLKKELLTENLSDDKRAEISAKLRDLQIANDNAVLDATIKNNDDKVKSDKEALAKRVEIASALINATTEIFGAISDYNTEQSEKRIAELENEKEKSNEYFENQKEKLDDALMSDETRAEMSKKIEEDKANAQKAIDMKIQSEKIKQAKWEKANNIVQAISGIALGIINSWKLLPPLNFINAGLVTTMGAIQLASIARQEIPAYEKGGVTSNEVALWGEKRPEIAVTPLGETFLAEKPTITKFDAGTRIYKSVSDYENFMLKKTGEKFTFDYDKMADKMPKSNINLDATGLWNVISSQSNRQKLINRRYKLN